MSFLVNLWGVLLELAPWLLLGAVVAGLLHGLLPPGFIHRQLRGPTGVLKAVLLGVPLPLCSCGVIPAGIGLKRDGASDGASIGFLTATPQTGVDSILVSASFLGWPFALTKVVAALVTGVASGVLTDTLAQSNPEGAARPTSEARPGPRQMVDHGLDLIRTIWGWLVFGVIVSAAITTFLPPDTFAGASAQGSALAFLIVLGASVPLYVCATASVPIAAALVEAGIPTGSAMVFLMAGPATNLATLGAVRQAFGTRSLAVYLGTIVAGSVAFGLGYEQVFGNLAPVQQGHHDHTAWWAQLGAVALTAMLAWFALTDARSWWSQRRAAQASAQELELSVTGLTCNGCASRLQRKLLTLEGVDSVVVSFDEHKATVAGTASEAQIRGAIKDAGFGAA